jgi:hypothetical protein
MCIVSTQYCSKWPEGVVDTAKINTHFPPLLSFLITAFTTTASGHLFCYIPLISILKKIIDLKILKNIFQEKEKRCIRMQKRRRRIQAPLARSLHGTQYTEHDDIPQLGAASTDHQKITVQCTMAHLISETRQKTAKTNEAVLALEKHANY